jgi:hypothetical protein
MVMYDNATIRRYAFGKPAVIDRIGNQDTLFGDSDLVFGPFGSGTLRRENYSAAQRRKKRASQRQRSHTFHKN